MWSPDACIEMLLIFSLKEVDERFKSGAVLPREKVMINTACPSGGAGQRGSSGQVDGPSWPGLAALCP